MAKKPKKKLAKKPVVQKVRPDAKSGSKRKPKRTKAMTDKDKEAAAEKEAAAKKEAAANTTLSPPRAAAPRSEAEAFNVPAEEMMTEQEKDAAGGGEGAGVGPVSPAEHTTGPVETIEDQGIGPRTPYPEGNPPPDTIVTTRSQGINRPDAPAVKTKPGETVKR